MKKGANYGFDFAEHISNPTCNNFVTPAIEFEDTNNNGVIRTIYAPDAHTGLPTGDLSYYVSGSAHPEIKQYILDNLLMDTSSAARPSLPDGLDDDSALELTRQRGESPQAYINRVERFMNDNVKVIERFKEIQAEKADKFDKHASTE